MMQKIQRFGGAMMAPVLLFAFSGIMLALSTTFQNEEILGSIAAEGTFWSNIWGIIEAGAWTIFDHMELLFVVGLPIGLAKKANARAILEAFVIYMVWNTFINAILQTWNFGIDLSNVDEAFGTKMIGGVATLNTSIIGSLLISGIAIWLHNRFYDTALPEWLGVFSGSSFVVILGFLVALPLAFLTVWVWPPIQNLILQLQEFMVDSGTAGVGIFIFLERALIPTGMHHFLDQSVTFGPAVVEGGLVPYWFEHLPEIIDYKGSLRDIAPGFGFTFPGLSKMFAPIGIGAAFITTAKPENKKKTKALIIPTALTAIVVGITEPFEFTFLFLAPQLFFVHALLAGGLAMTIYALGVSGHIGGGIDHITQFAIPMSINHKDALLIIYGVGLLFSVIYFFIFRWAILKFDIKTPGRETQGETNLYYKADYKNKKKENNVTSSVSGSSPVRASKNPNAKKASHFLEGLGGAANVVEINNCATRLRISVADETQVLDDGYFKNGGAHGVVRNGKALQIIVGLDVPKVKDFFEEIVEDENGSYEEDK